MAAYVIGHINVKDAGKWAEYRVKVPATLAQWGGELVLRGRRITAAAPEERRGRRGRVGTGNRSTARARRFLTKKGRRESRRPFQVPCAVTQDDPESPLSA